MALLLISSLALTACTDDNEHLTQVGTPLQLNVQTAAIQSRGLIESATLPDGHAIGLTLVDVSDATYDNIAYNNIKATSSTGKVPQTWTLANDILLSATNGVLYGYYPYNEDVTDITQIPVAVDDTDYMYATPVTEVNDGKATPNVVMNHALAAIRLNIVRGTYTGTGQVTAVSVKGDNIATFGTLNAKTGALTSLTGTGSAVTNSTAFTLSTTAKQIDCIIVPVINTSAAPTITMTIDGKEYIATPSAVTFEQGSIYQYTLTVDAKDISLSDVTVGDWGYSDSGNPVIHAGYNITLAGDIEGIAFSNTVNDDGSVTIKAVPVEDNAKVKEVACSSNVTCTQTEGDNGMRTIVLNNLQGDVTVTFNGLFKPVVGSIDLTTASNGVYAVAQNGKGVTIADADESCIAVALIVNDAPTPQRLMIEKNGEENTTSIKAAYEADGATNTGVAFYWGMQLADITSITNYALTGGGGTTYYGYLPRADGTYQSTPNLSGDYTTWTSGALSDFNGKANTAAIIATPDTDSNTRYANMGTYCTIFNATAAENQGYTDWYIPACGQLSLMHLNWTAINNALTKIGGWTIMDTLYWSSSEYGSSEYDGAGGYWVSLGDGKVSSYGKGMVDLFVRFVRDI